MLVLILLALSACGGKPPATSSGASETGNSPSGQAQPAPGPSSAFPKKIVHAKGETVLERKPQKVAILYFPYADHLFAIGEQQAVAGVVGLSSLRNFPVYEPFVKDGRIADLGDQANLENILALEPDVIIAWEQDEKIVDDLAKIADTIVIPQSENWQDTITKVAAVLGEEEKAQRYIDQYNAKLDRLAAKMETSGEKGKSAIFMMTWGNGFNYYGGVRMQPYYDKLGFRRFDGMKDWGEISLEGVSAIDPDYLFVGEDFTRTAQMTLKQLETNPVWTSLKAVRSGKLIVVDTEIVGPLAMGQSKGLDVIEKTMGN
ncbi:ABC transporter substrate-binding protein [Paenibacillus flagellatus]|uniref:ABC transporter substrate-binding protein n=2 Tax=Paenibacillus flagellatus TaxID=2211139 RepID=A0A2V5K963_9BACL|nr:ABC transporter substrate-binding protein [Paenibacillus flagellatus]